MKIADCFLYIIIYVCLREVRGYNEETFASIKDKIKQSIEDGELLDLVAEIGDQFTNPLLLDHSHYFQDVNGNNGQIYQIGVDEYTKPFTPDNLVYRAYSAVGYGLANAILLVNDEGFVVIDTGSHPENAQLIIQAYQDLGVLNSGAGDGEFFDPPLRAVIYTHNHIDHTGGSNLWISKSRIPACPARNDGVDEDYKARGNCVEVISHTKVPSAVVNTALRTGQIINTRSLYMYGSAIDPPNNGIGPPETGSESTFHPPTKTFSNTMLLKVIGLEMQLRYVPSETDDEIIAFLPDCLNSNSKGNRKFKGSKSGGKSKCKVDYTTPPQELGFGLMAAAEAVQGPSFPNLYSLRGTTFRNPLTWYQSVDVLRRYDSWAFVPSHGVPLMGDSNIESLLVNFRDAIAVVHDQTLRYIRLGYIPDELVEMVSLPDYVLDNLESISGGLPVGQTPRLSPRDYLRTFYGSVPQSIRELYSGYLGWNEGDPTFFKPLPPKERANRYVEQMGGAEAVLNAANKAFEQAKADKDKQEFQWVAELLVNVIRASTTTASQLEQAKLLKAKAFLILALTDETDPEKLEDDWFSLNPNWRNWFITGALELALTSNNEDFRFPTSGGLGLTSKTIQGGLEPDNWVQHWSWRFNAENNALDGVTYGWQMLPNATYWGSSTQRFILQVDGQVVRFIDDPIDVAAMFDNVDRAVSIDHPTFQELILSDATYDPDAVPTTNQFRFVEKFKQLIDDGFIKVLKGNAEDAALFYSPENFDPTPGTTPLLVSR